LPELPFPRAEAEADAVAEAEGREQGASLVTATAAEEPDEPRSGTFSATPGNSRGCGSEEERGEKG
jgi:hypothetical protein